MVIARTQRKSYTATKDTDSSLVIVFTADRSSLSSFLTARINILASTAPAPCPGFESDFLLWSLTPNRPTPLVLVENLLT